VPKLPYLEITGYILIFGSILFLAYVAARYAGKKALTTTKSKHMQLVEQIHLGLDKRLLLVRVGSDYFLFLSGRKEFRQVARVNLDKDEVREVDDSGNNISAGFDFKQVFTSYLTSFNEKRQQIKSKNKSTDIKNEKSEAIRENIRKLERLREKSNDKEVK
jgi:flagellar biogenesis protein FliO